MNGTMVYEYITILFKTGQIDVKVKFYHRLNVEENKTHKNFIITLGHIQKEKTNYTP